jgi:hypothetical protein
MAKLGMVYDCFIHIVGLFWDSHWSPWSRTASNKFVLLAKSANYTSRWVRDQDFQVRFLLGDGSLDRWET